MRHRCFSMMLVAVVFVLLPLRAAATFHLIKIVEVFPGTAAHPDAQYVMLQMYFSGQNLVTAHSLTVFGAHDEVLATLTFPTNVANGANQATILIGTTAANALFGLPRDLFMNAVLPLSGGKICWESFDCVSWGDYAGSRTSPSPSGTPFNAPGLVLGKALRRNLGIDGNPATLSAADDTNDSGADFTLAVPAPKNNAGTALCVGDCGYARQVSIGDLVTMLTVALGNAGPSSCPNSAWSDDTISVTDVLSATSNALDGCVGP